MDENKLEVFTKMWRDDDLGSFCDNGTSWSPLYTEEFSSEMWVKCQTDKAWLKLGHATGQWTQALEKPRDGDVRRIVAEPSESCA